MLLFFSCYYHMAMLKLSLVWFGLYICPTNLNHYIGIVGWAKEKVFSLIIFFSTAMV